MDQLNFPIPPYFDPVAVREELSSYWRESSENVAQARARVLKRLKELKAHAREQAQAALERTRDGRRCAAALSQFQDELIKLIYDFSAGHIYRARNPTAAERMALVATGGYGRGLLAPGSDIDLLFLLPYKQTAWGESMVESVLYFLWDLGFKVGHATRTVDQTLKAAKEDMTIRTALLDARLIYGETALFNDLWTRFVGNVVQGSQREFIAAKLEEREQRLKRIGMSRYRVEPNIKDGKGGLRDLNMLHWFALYLNPGEHRQPERGIFAPDEAAVFNRCEAFLWTIRCYLHFLAGKSEERLSFDLQPEMASLLRYHDRLGLLGVERFMKHYFLVAKDVGDLTRTVCSSLELLQLKTVPTLSDFLGTLPWSNRAKLAATTDFRVDNNRLNVKQPDVFKKDPVNLIRFFVEAERNNLLVHPQAIRLIRSSLKLIDDNFRANPEANSLFLECLTSGNAPETALRYMNEAGVLGRFIPDFGRIVAMATFNMYHHYTIDEHTIRAVGILSQIEKGGFSEEHPLSTAIIAGLQHRRALYLALLMHDVAKAVKGDHSVVGAEMARKLALRMGFERAEADTTAWLVRHHLLMSITAQHRDIGDPQTVRNFADIVQSPERLKLLLLLTVADIRAVGPGIFSAWKGQLLRSLYYDSEPLLGGGHTHEPRAARIEMAQVRLREAIAHWPHAEVERFIQRHETDYWLKTDIERQVQHAQLLRSFEGAHPPVTFEVKSDAFRGLTELTLVTEDHPRLLALFSGACAAAGANITSAQISTTKDGIALDTLFLQRFFPDEEEIERAGKIARTIGDILSGKRSMDTLETLRKRVKPKTDAFTVPPDVILDNTASQELTVIEVQALDRPGLLFDLARGLSDLGLDISSAHIATFGEKAVDVFYVTCPSKKKVASDEDKRMIRERLLNLLGAG
ncbi:MAG: [protein-PII] uridylyltransferase [Rhodomicrobium sp.]